MKSHRNERTIRESDNNEVSCPNCGMEKKDWEGNLGHGYEEEGETYCCKGCAEKTGCTCEQVARMEEEGGSSSPAKDQKTGGSFSGGRR